ncbi:MAG: M48 family peptidase [Planctomycetota bacterium]|nr:MAG: M48 family peptidase [Planctomycetota bacterium]
MWASWCSSGCRTAPETGRKQLVLIPEEQEIAMGELAYRDILANTPESKDEQLRRIVQRVGERIAAVAGRPDYRWEFHLLSVPEPNAFCLPGGKIAVFEGILPVCENEAGLAAVLSHEVAHALARHGGERMSQGLVVSAVELGLKWGLKDRDAVARERILQAYGIASKYGVLLPYSRKHELEADAIGLRLMARAGYDPHEAVRLWQRFADFNRGQRIPEFFSTHPSDTHRARALAELMPEAERLYAAAERRMGTGQRLSVGTERAQSVEQPQPAGSGTQPGRNR